MANGSSIPSDQPKTVVTSTILSGGTAVSTAYHVLSVVVSKEVNRIPTALIVMVDGDVASQTFEISNTPDFEPGKEIEIKLGYQSSEETIFKGIVVKHSIKTRKNNSVLMIECKDKAAKMTAACKSNYFRETKDSDVMEQLIDAYGLNKEVEATTVEHKQLVQYNTTDWDFMLCRAEVNGLLCIADDGKLKIAKPDFAGEPALTIEYGATILELDAEIDARLQYKEVKGVTWLYPDQELNEVAATEPSLPNAGNLDGATLANVLNEEAFVLYHSGKIEEPELQQWIDAKLMKHRLAKIRGNVVVEGTSDVNPGQVIEIKGIGERFEGKLFVTAVRHEYTNGDWQTSLQFGINPEWFAQTYNVQQPMAGAMLPAIEGLQVGIVTQLESDPDGEDRIMVRIPVIHKEDEGAWCRVSSLDAGKERGMFFRPEINDEVIVGFINNDPRHGVVLGMMNSSKMPAHLTAKDDNHEKGYQSRSKLKMIFNDDKKSICIETPGGHKVVIDEDQKKIHIEDLNGNKMTMNDEGITIESIKDIKMKAAAEIKMEAGSDATLKAGAQTKVSGGAGAEISSGGTTDVKGSMVNIN
ncbi:MAG: type VI secretion system tip protein VgrG [Bacteroidota bacterium]